MDLTLRPIHQNTKVADFCYWEQHLYLLTYSQSLYHKDLSIGMLQFVSLAQLGSTITNVAVYESEVLIIDQNGGLYQLVGERVKLIMNVPLPTPVVQLNLYSSRVIVTCSDQILEVKGQEVRIVFKSQDLIEFVSLQYPRLLVSTEKYYYSVDARESSCTRIGTNPKKERYGCTIYNEHMLCGRTNGIIWKAHPQSGKVETSYQFTHLDQKIVQCFNLNTRIGMLFVLSQFLVVSSAQATYVIDLATMTVLRKLDIQPTMVRQQGQSLVMYDGTFWLVECLPLQESFELNLQHNPREAGIQFVSHLNSFDNALKLLKTEQPNEVKEAMLAQFKSRSSLFKATNLSISKINQPQQTNMFQVVKDVQAYPSTVIAADPFKFVVPLDSQQPDCSKLIARHCNNSTMSIDRTIEHLRHILRDLGIHAPATLPLLNLLDLLPASWIVRVLEQWDSRLNHLRYRYLMLRCSHNLLWQNTFTMQLNRLQIADQINGQLSAVINLSWLHFGFVKPDDVQKLLSASM